MNNKEIILKKMVAQEREWTMQMLNLQIIASKCDGANRIKFQQCIENLDSKLKHVQRQISELKVANEQLWETYGDKIAEIWEELVHNVDYVISNYKKSFSLEE